ncbi:MAG: N-acetylneuraminate synthase [Deltaproteobacteria bacterium]|nr:N-acetylneuraminate synthase [Deltaproteobacteria bacterium]
MTQRPFRLGTKEIGGPGDHCYVIAEAGVNHDGNLEDALRLVDAAATAGADAVKFQTFSAERLVAPTARKAAYQMQATDPAESQLAMLRRLELDRAAHRQLQERAALHGIAFLSSPFDEESADLLEDLAVPAFKVASGEITNLPFLRHMARKGRPLLLSTGMSTLAEVAEAVEAIRLSGDPPLALFHCVSSYPAEAADANLRAMQTLRETFRVPVGFSDHTNGMCVSIAAAACGASLLEKHVTLDRRRVGPDHAASLEPAEFTSMVADVRVAGTALGSGVKEPRPAELDVREVARKSVTTRRDLVAGAAIARADLAVLRPGTGIRPADIDRLVGRRPKKFIAAGTTLSWELFE